MRFALAVTEPEPPEPPEAPVRAGYSGVAIVLHWLIAALLLFEIALGLNMKGAQGSAKFAVFQLHKSVGVTILLLVLLRILWRLRRRPPPITATGWERALALTVHGAFYALLLALPISGWIAVSTSKIVVPTLLYGTVPWPHLPGFASMAAEAKETWHEVSEFVHVNLVNLLYLLVGLHVAGALKHHFIDRDASMARMAPGMRTGSWSDPRLVGIVVVAAVAGVIGLEWGASPAGVGAPAETTPFAVQSAASEPTASASPAVTEEPDAEASAAAEQEVPKWAIASGSSLRFRTTWSGEAIAGGFSTFSGDIAFDPERLDQSRVTITVDTGSVSSGDASRDETLKDADWFAVAANRNAVFQADNFRKTGAERYVAQGTLRMKGVSAPLSIPFSLRIAGDRATMRGTATIDRLAYRIGEGEFTSTSEIPAAVAIDIAVTASRR